MEIINYVHCKFRYFACLEIAFVLFMSKIMVVVDNMNTSDSFGFCTIIISHSFHSFFTCLGGLGA